ncbi:MFS transporter [Halostella sp. JP-L12]|uniref:MFS transporter n=1 Tax=Halostella TaxID=1843185 RepID=UPI000EF7F1F9|nr:MULTISPECIES: MFS transporter [Halostella]NHN49710.1 MFS transporter [Halostella sp. JP-L12]
MNGNDRSIVGLVMVGHAMVHTYELSIPILVSVWLLEFSTTAATLGLVVTAGYALFGAGALPGGMLADTYGSQRVIAACLLGMSGSFLALSVAPSIPFITLALLLWGIAASVYHPSGLALISKGVSERGSAFAYHGMAGNAGIALGPLATTLLLIPFEWRAVVGLLAVPAALGGLYAIRADVDESAEVAADGDGRSGAVSSLEEFVDGTRALFSGAFVGIFLVVIMSGLYYRGVLTFLPEVLGEFDAFAPVTVGREELEPARYAYVALLMVGMAGQFVGGKLTDRIRPELGIGAAFGALAVLALAFVPAADAGLGPFLVVGAALGFTLFVVQPLYQATVAEYTPAGTRGLSYGFTYLGTFGIGALGGTVAGAVLTYGTSLTLFLVLAVVAATASATGFVLARR